MELETRPDRRDVESLDLDGLAEAVDEEHEKIEGAMRAAVAHAVRAGRLLNEAKDRVQHGEWTSWVEEYTTVAPRTAQLYMRVSRRLPELPDEEAQHVADLPLRKLDEVLREDTESEAVEASEEAENQKAERWEDMDVEARKTHLRERFRELREQEDLGGWEFGFNDNKRRHGVCRYREQRIELARHTLSAPLHEVEDVLLHEIAHAVAPRGARHEEGWKQEAKRLGAEPTSYTALSPQHRPMPPYYLVCVECGMKLADRWRRTDISTKSHAECPVGALTYLSSDEWSPGEPLPGRVKDTEENRGGRFVSADAAEQARERVSGMLTDKDGGGIETPTTVWIEKVIEHRHAAPDHAVDRLVEELEDLARRAQGYANSLRGLHDDPGGGTVVEAEVEDAEPGTRSFSVTEADETGSE